MRSQHLFVAAMAALLATTSAQASVEISSKPTRNMNCSGGVCTPTAAKAVLNVADLLDMLASGDTTVKSDSQAQDIVVHAKVALGSGSRLTLDSYRSIEFNKFVDVKGAGAITITVNDGSSGGDYRFTGSGHVEFRQLTSSLIINGQAFRLVHDVAGMNKNRVHGVAPYFALAKSFTLNRTYHNLVVKKGVAAFEGLGNTIQNLSINADPGTMVGLFQQAGTVRDFKLTNVDINAGVSSCVGAIVPTNDGEILYSSATGRIVAGANSTVGDLHATIPSQALPA